MITVIIPVKNGMNTLPDCLAGVLAQRDLLFGVDYEVIIVDDGSTDETAKFAAQKGVRVICQPNAGPASARNNGARAARGNILAFTDADCVPASDWLTHLTQPFQDPTVVGVKGTYRTHQSQPVSRFVQLEYETKYRRMEKLPSIDFIDTYCAAYRTHIFLENQGFDTHFPVPSVEDQEFSFRLARKGYRMVFAPSAVVYHRHDRNLIEYFERKFNIGYWKACMLRWIPEKTFDDSHTLPSQRWQILLLGLAALCLPLAFLYPLGAWFMLGLLVLFYLTAISSLSLIFQRDRGIFLFALVLLVVRAAALGLGLLTGLIFAPQTQREKPHALTMSQRFAKRALDIILAGLGLLFCVPFFPLVALAIRLDSTGPIFYSQERAGEHGKPFRIHKFRTMVVGAEKLLVGLIDLDELKEPVFKLRQDPRVTRVGKVLRRWSMDEIPQLWNVLCGEMSLVGPRPEETWLVARYTDAQRQRLAVKPGLTGPMQVSGRAELDFEKRLELELDYIQNYSFGKDLIILLKSIPAVIFGKGAF